MAAHGDIDEGEGREFREQADGEFLTAAGSLGEAEGTTSIPTGDADAPAAAGSLGEAEGQAVVVGHADAVGGAGAPAEAEGNALVVFGDADAIRARGGPEEALGLAYDPRVSAGVLATPRLGSLPFSGRIRLTRPRRLGAGSPIGQARAYIEATVGVKQSSGGAIRQAGNKRQGAARPLVVPTDQDPLHVDGYHVRTGEVTVTLHDLLTDPTASLQIEQHEPRDLEITYISMDIESED